MTLIDQAKELENEFNVRRRALIERQASKEYPEFEGSVSPFFMLLHGITNDLAARGIGMFYRELTDRKKVSTDDLKQAFDVIQNIWLTHAQDIAGYATDLERAGKLVIDRGETE